MTNDDKLSVTDAINRHEWLHWAYETFTSRRIAVFKAMYSKPSPFHPGYGLPDDFRMRVIRYADSYGIDAAAQKYKVGASSIYRWMAAFKKETK